MRKTKKLLAMLLCFVMCLGLFPVSAFAEEGAEAPVEEETVAATELVQAAEEPAPAPEPEVEEPEPAAEEPAPEVDDTVPAAEAEVPAEEPATPDATEGDIPAQMPETPETPAEETDIPAAEDAALADAEAEPAQDAEAAVKEEDHAIAEEEDAALSVQSMEPYEFEDENGILYGYEGRERDIDIAGNVNRDYPTVAGFSMELYTLDPSGSGEYLIKSDNVATISDPEYPDWVRFSVWLSDQDGISNAMLWFGPEGKYVSLSSTDNCNSTLEAVEYEGFFPFSSEYANGDYSVLRAAFYDYNGFYTVYDGNNAKALKTVKAAFPGTIKFKQGTSGSQGSNAPVQNIVLTENKKALTAGQDAFHLSFSIEAGLSLSNLQAEFSLKEINATPITLSMWDGTLSYDSDTGIVSTPAEGILLDGALYNGTYFLSGIFFEDSSGNTFRMNYDHSMCWFTLSGGTDAAEITISDVTCDRANTTVTDWETITVSFSVKSMSEITGAGMELQLLSAQAKKNPAGITTGSEYTFPDPYSVSVNIQKVDGTDDLYTCELSYNFNNSDIYGTYAVAYVYAQAGDISTYAATNLQLSFMPLKTETPETQEYLRLPLNAGGASIRLFDYSGEISDFNYFLQNEYGEEEDAGVLSSYNVSTDGYGYVSPGSQTGTAYLCASLTVPDQWGYEWDEAYGYYSWQVISYKDLLYRCRIDVVDDTEDFEISQVSLPVNKTTVELYSSNYTRVAVLPEMDYISAQDILLDAGDLPVPEDRGYSLLRARFTAPDAESLFELKVVDDRTLEIVPLYSTLLSAQEKASNVKGSYKSGIEVTIADPNEDSGERVLTVKAANGKNAELSMTVKKTVPTLKANSLAFNSIINTYANDGRIHGLDLFPSGTKVINIEPDFTAAIKAKKPAIPDYIMIENYGSSEDPYYVALLSEPLSKSVSGKLYLLATLDGWAIKKSIVVNYSVKNVSPNLTFNPNSVTLTPGTSDHASIAVKLAPSNYIGNFNYIGNLEYDSASQTYESSDGWVTLRVRKVVDTKAKKTVADTPEEIADIVDIRSTSGYLTDGLWVRLGPGAESNKTYQVVLEFCGKEFSFKVATPEKVKLTVKQGGSLYGNYFGEISLTPSISSYHKYAVTDYEVIIREGSSEDGTEVARFENGDSAYADLFEVGYWYWNNGRDVYQNRYFDTFYVYQHNYLDASQKTKPVYYAYITAILSDDGSDPVRSNTVKTKLNIKWTVPSTFNYSTKVSGSIDVIRPYSEIAVTVSQTSVEHGTMQFENLLPRGMLSFRKNGVDISVDDDAFPFEYESRWNGTQWVNYIWLKDGTDTESLQKDKYSLHVFSSEAIKTGKVVFKDYKLSIKNGSAKVIASPGSVIMLSKDSLSQGQITLTPTDRKLASIRDVQIAKGMSSPFFITPMGNNIFALGFKNMNGIKAGQTKTVKLNIWFEGSWSTEPDATVSVKVPIK